MLKLENNHSYIREEAAKLQDYNVICNIMQCKNAFNQKKINDARYIMLCNVILITLCDVTQSLSHYVALLSNVMLTIMLYYAAAGNIM